MNQKTLTKTIRKYYKTAKNPDSRFRSWDHCYGFFQKNYNNLQKVEVENEAALRLGFYLASWGMYRGSGFLLEYTYEIHKFVIRELALSKEFLQLCPYDVGTNPNDINLAPDIKTLVQLIRNAYYNNLNETPTDTLISKILLGTTGCLPACDTYFVKGFRSEGNPYPKLNKKFIKNILGFCINKRQELGVIQPTILSLDEHPYPRMKLVDMLFWQIGKDL